MRDWQGALLSVAQVMPGGVIEAYRGEEVSQNKEIQEAVQEFCWSLLQVNQLLCHLLAVPPPCCDSLL